MDARSDSQDLDQADDAEQLEDALTHDDEPGLTGEEEAKASDHQALLSKVVYETIRQEGEEELRRPTVSLWWSGCAAGVVMSSSLLVMASLHALLPDAPWRRAVTSLGYSVGFVIVILGRMQLFTENTITAVLPLLSEPTRKNFVRVARLWIVVLLANFVGTFASALMTEFLGIVPTEITQAALEISGHVADKGFWKTLQTGIPAGFLIAAVVWCAPNAKSAQFWVIVMLTYAISIAGLSHVVAGSNELFLLALHGEIGALTVLEHIAGAFLGNVIGGTVLFTLLAYGQVREEI